MRSFCRFAFLLALAVAGVQAVPAQSSSSSSQASAQSQSQSGQVPTLNQQEMTVQDRIRMRREQRRQQAIHDTYGHLYEIYTAMGYLRFTPGPSLQRVTLYGWDTGLTRYYNVHLGVTADARAYYGTAYVGINSLNITKPAISHYDFLIGPTYRFLLLPKYSVAGRVMGGYAFSDFSGDTNGSGSTALGLYPDGGTYAISADILGEYNVSPSLAVRLGGTDYVTGFGSTMQNSVGFTGGFVLRFGKQ
ncbi:MAG TPA: hypothetical protein VMA34_20710 [Terracidiphilus sp.]|nr:hypothetical protein [Terracidiphilus sp.]